jgi:predicted lipid-binding transport protein (Tim44 family)
MFSLRARSRATLVVGVLLALAARALAADASVQSSPEEVVRTYLAALQKGDYKTAYPLLTPDMQSNLDEEKWVAEQTVVMKVGEVTINSYRVFPAKMEGKDKAIVPNLLKSRDKYINKAGKNEYELYTLVRDPDHKWRIAQQALVETDAVHKWFPADVPVE